MKTHCKKGHPFDEKNTRIALKGARAGRRYCITCSREADKRAYHENIEFARARQRAKSKVHRQRHAKVIDWNDLSQVDDAQRLRNEKWRLLAAGQTVIVAERKARLKKWADLFEEGDMPFGTISLDAPVRADPSQRRHSAAFHYCFASSALSPLEELMWKEEQGDPEAPFYEYAGSSGVQWEPVF